MRLLVDSNIIFAALIRDSAVRHLFQHIDAELFMLSINLEEIQEHKSELLMKSRFSEGAFAVLLDTLASKCHILDDNVLLKKMDDAERIMDPIDPDDTPFIAAALAIGASIWSDDAHFKKQDEVRVFTTKELIAKLKM
jgi:predicted nucleic acid-binding protein